MAASSVSPWKWRRKPPASLVDSMPTIKWIGLETRSSRSASARATDLASRRIMPAVDPDFRAGRRQIVKFSRRKPLKPRGPDGGAYAFRNRLLRDVEAFQRPRGGDGRAGVVELMPPEQARQRQIEEAVLVLEDEPAVLLEHVPALPSGKHRGAKLARARFDHAKRRIALAGHDGGPAALQNARLLARDGLDGVAEKGAVIERNRGQHGRKRRIDHVRGVEPSAEACFQKHDIGWISENARKAAAVVISKNVIGSPRFAASARVRMSMR